METLLRYKKPVWLAISLSDDDGTTLRSGEKVSDIFSVIDDLKPDALLINCSLPESIDVALPLITDIITGKGIPVGAYANGFTKISKAFQKAATTVDNLERREDLNPERHADFVSGWIEQGATIIGGCCEVGPTHIREIARRYKTASKEEL